VTVSLFNFIKNLHTSQRFVDIYHHKNKSSELSTMRKQLFNNVAMMKSLPNELHICRVKLQRFLERTQVDSRIDNVSLCCGDKHSRTAKFGSGPAHFIITKSPPIRFNTKGAIMSNHVV
jgi:hypothetical protein